jgi:hypothetical protein
LTKRGYELVLGSFGSESATFKLPHFVEANFPGLCENLGSSSLELKMRKEGDPL